MTIDMSADQPINGFTTIRIAELIIRIVDITVALFPDGIRSFIGPSKNGFLDKPNPMTKIGARTARTVPITSARNTNAFNAMQ